MSRTCDICGKHTSFGNTVSKSYNHKQRTWKPNLVNMTVLVGGKPQKIKICTRCVRTDYFEKKVRLPKSAATAQ